MSQRHNAYYFEEEEAPSLMFFHTRNYVTSPPLRLQHPSGNGQQYCMAPAPSYVHHDDRSALRLSQENMLFLPSVAAEYDGGNGGINQHHRHQYYHFMHDPQHQVAGSGVHAASSSLQLTSINRSETLQESQGSGQLHREFLNFLVSDHGFLTSVGHSIPEAMIRIRGAFEAHIQQNGLSLPPSIDLDRIFQSFKPVIGTPAIRRESDTRMNPNRSVRIVCPFPFCDNHYTRSANLRNHLAAHFALTPQQCFHCGRWYSDTSIVRHMDGCNQKSTFR